MVTTILIDLLREAEVSWPEDADEERVAARIAASARAAGVHVLCLEALRARSTLAPVAERLRELLRSEALREAMRDLVREREVTAVLDELERVGVPNLVLKGGGLAYTHYAASHHRPRCDTDLLVRPEDAERAEAVFAEAGYRRFPSVRGRVICHESAWLRPGPRGEPIQFDLHWRALNVPGFAHLLPYDELESGARTLPALSPHARAPGDVHALLLGALHLVGNDRRGAGHRLIWLMDLTRIGSGLDDAAWVRVAEFARRHEVRSAVAVALTRAEASFGLAIPEAVRAILSAPEAAREVTAPYVDADHRRALLTDLRALARWSDRARLLLEHAFPPADYLRWRFGVTQRTPVAALHLRRLLGAAPRRART